MKIITLAMTLFLPATALPLKVVILPFENLTKSDALEWMGRSLQRSISLELRRAKDIQVMNTRAFEVPKYERLLSEYVSLMRRHKAEVLISGSYGVEGMRLIVSVVILGSKEISKGFGISMVGNIGILDIVRIAGRTDMVYELKRHISRLTKLELIGVMEEGEVGGLPLLDIGGETSKKVVSVDITYAKEALSQLGKIDISTLKEDIYRRRLEAMELFNRGVEIGDGSDKEISFYIKALLVDPDLAHAWYNLGVLFLRRGDIPRTIYHLVGFLERAKEQDFLPLRDRVKTVFFRIIPRPEDTDFDRDLALKFLERALDLADFSDEEIRHLETTVRADPTLWPARKRLAEVFFVRGMYSRSLREYREYLTVSNDPPEMIRRIKRVVAHLQGITR